MLGRGRGRGLLFAPQRRAGRGLGPPGRVLNPAPNVDDDDDDDIVPVPARAVVEPEEEEQEQTPPQSPTMVRLTEEQREHLNELRAVIKRIKSEDGMQANIDARRLLLEEEERVRAQVAQLEVRLAQLDDEIVMAEAPLGELFDAKQRYRAAKDALHLPRGYARAMALTTHTPNRGENRLWVSFFCKKIISNTLATFRIWMVKLPWVVRYLVAKASNLHTLIAAILPCIVLASVEITIEQNTVQIVTSKGISHLINFFIPCQLL